MSRFAVIAGLFLILTALVPASVQAATVQALEDQSAAAIQGEDSAQAPTPSQPASSPVKSSQMAPGIDTVPAVLNVVLSLLLVIAAIFASIWGAKRLSGLSVPANKNMRVLGGMSVGPKERVVLIDVAGKQILIGVAPGSVNCVHAFDEPQVDLDETGVAASGAFADKLSQFLRPGKDSE